MSRAIVILTDQGGTEFIGGAEYLEGRVVIDGDGYITLYDPLRITIATDGSNFRSVMTPPGSFDWTTKTRFYRPSITEAGPMASTRYATNVEEYKKEYAKQVESGNLVQPPKKIIQMRKR